MILENMEWLIGQDSFDKDTVRKNESIFTVASGYLGLRGDLDENDPQDGICTPGTYINGFYEKEVIQYGERAHGFAEYGQTMVNICNPKRLRVTVQGETFCYADGSFSGFERKLNMQHGESSHKLVWKTAAGISLMLEGRRIVSMTNGDTALLDYTITAVDGDCDISMETMLDTSVSNQIVANDPRVGSGLKGKPITTNSIVCRMQDGSPLMAVTESTHNSELTYCCAMTAHLSVPAVITLAAEKPSAVFTFTLKKGEQASLYRTIMVTFDKVNPNLQDTLLPRLLQIDTVQRDILFSLQKEYLSDFWSHADISITENPLMTQGLRFNLFHLLQSVGKDGRTSIAAKGLTGEGYEGHFFWEAEAYIAPVFMFTQPHIAQAMLHYRYTILHSAHRQAELLGHKSGVLYPWRSIGGDECSAYFPAGSAQYHINGDICYAIERYFSTTGDLDFIAKFGAEIVWESARLWLDVGHYRGDEFCIDCVTGPDEYTAIVNNNCYTNIMAQQNLRLACRFYTLLQEQCPQRFNELINTLKLTQDEITQFEKAADNMRLPYDKERGIYMQDDSFLDKAVLDFSELKRPLLLHYHPLFIYRHQVCKQADWLLAVSYMYNRFDRAQKRRDFDYYNKVTTHDSSLSPCIHSIVAADIGYDELAHSMFLKTVRTDLDDIHNNTKDGLHMANMAGAWGCMMFGFAGASVDDGALRFNPHKIFGEKGYTVSFTYQGAVMVLVVQNNQVTFRLKNRTPVTFFHGTEEITLSEQTPEQTRPIY